MTRTIKCQAVMSRFASYPPSPAALISVYEDDAEAVKAKKDYQAKVGRLHTTFLIPVEVHLKGDK